MKRKLLLLSVSILIALLACSQNQTGNGFNINGNIKGIGESIVYLKGNTPEGYWVDSVKAEHGEFFFKGYGKEPGLFYLTVKGKKEGFPIILENSQIFIKGVWDSLPEVIISGSKENDLYEKYIQELEPINNEMTDLNEIYTVVKPEKGTKIFKLLDDKINKLFERECNISRQFINNYPKAYVSAAAFDQFYRTMSPDEAQTWFAKIDPRVRSYVIIKDFPEQIKAKRKTELGKPAINFSLPSSKGQMVSLSSVQKDYKYVLIDFWASWCSPCRAENPNIKKAYQMFHDQGFEIVAVSLDDEKAKWSKAIKEDGLPWIHVSDLKIPNEVAKMYGVEGVPTNFLIGPEGKIVAKSLHGERLIKKLEEVFRKS